MIEHDVQPQKFGSIPDAMWWAAATVSTVGYGDVVPVTPLGRIVGVFTMITGLLMLALPASIVATSFAGIINRHNFVVTAGMVARMPLFRGMEAAAVIDLLPAISRRTFDRTDAIIHQGEVRIAAPDHRWAGRDRGADRANGARPGGAFGGDPDNSSFLCGR